MGINTSTLLALDVKILGEQYPIMGSLNRKKTLKARLLKKLFFLRFIILVVAAQGLEPRTPGL